MSDAIMFIQRSNARAATTSFFGLDLITSVLRESLTRTDISALRLEDLVLQLLDMDEHEAAAVAALKGEPSVLFRRDPEHFLDILLQVIRHYRLSPLFSRDPECEHHRSVHPAAYHRRAGEPYPADMAQWRSDFRAMNPEQQMFSATLIWMYQAGPDSTWLRRVPCTWRASEALQYLSDAGCLARWLMLMAHYVPW
ncbi:hypothetical protein [Dyella sp. EPa41]|uniref:hypothetical protein n=1 Tax=Dyella sp. EPa41 TaxID=1561194 RepID=UPI001914E12C|nr:hypothetical protein [Dyella sp. EPa41]